MQRAALRTPTAPVDYQSLRFDYQRIADQDARRAGAPSGGGRRRRAGRPGAGHRPRAARRAGRAARQRRHAVHRLARHLLRQAHAGDLRPPRLRRAHGRQGRVVERRHGVLRATSRSTASTCCPRPATSGRPSSTCSSTTSRATSPSAPPQLPLIDLRWKQQGRRRRAARRPRAADHRDARRPVPRSRPTTSPPATARAPALRAAARARRARAASFRDRFLIADVKMEADLPAERWFWFDPPFHPNQSVLLHKQPDGVWRIDFQLGWDADPEEERKPENIIPRVQALLDSTRPRGRRVRARMGQRLHLRLPAHGALPPRPRAVRGRLGARRVAVRRARRELGRAGRRQPGLEARRRAAAARRPTRCSTATPASANTRPTRTSATRRAPPTSSRPRARSAGCSATPCWSSSKTHAFARTLVNSGRLSVPATLHGSPLNTPDADAFDGAMVPGAPAADAPRRARRRQRRLAAARTGPRRRARRASRRWCSATATRPSAACARWRRPTCRCTSCGVAADRRRRSSPPSATTRGPAPSTCCAPTSTSARAGAAPTPPRSCAPRCDRALASA